MFTFSFFQRSVNSILEAWPCCVMPIVSVAYVVLWLAHHCSQSSRPVTWRCALIDDAYGIVLPSNHSARLTGALGRCSSGARQVVSVSPDQRGAWTWWRHNEQTLWIVVFLPPTVYVCRALRCVCESPVCVLISLCSILWVTCNCVIYASYASCLTLCDE